MDQPPPLCNGAFRWNARKQLTFTAVPKEWETRCAHNLSRAIMLVILQQKERRTHSHQSEEVAAHSLCRQSVSTTSPDLGKDDISCSWPTGWDPKAGAQQAADPRKSRTCERAIRGGAAGREDRNQRAAVLPSSRRGTVPPASRTNEDGRSGHRGGKMGLPGNRKVVATWYGDDSPLLSLPPHPQPQFSQRQYWWCARVLGKAGETVNNLRKLRPQRVKGSTRSKVGTMQIWLRVTTCVRTGR